MMLHPQLKVFPVLGSQIVWRVMGVWGGAFFTGQSRDREV
jgi:hypothetical protein